MKEASAELNKPEFSHYKDQNLFADHYAKSPADPITDRAAQGFANWGAKKVNQFNSPSPNGASKSSNNTVGNAPMGGNGNSNPSGVSLKTGNADAAHGGGNSGSTATDHDYNPVWSE